MRNILLTFFLLLGGLGVSYSQISGPTTVNGGSTQTYSYTSSLLVSPIWSITNGTLISQTSGSFNYTATITWSSTATSGSIVLRDGGSPPKGSLTVTISQPPLAPVASAATSVASNSFSANWGSVSGATSYSLDVSTSNTFSSFVTGYNALSVSVASQNVSSLSPNTTYYYRVRAVNSAGTSSASNVITTLTTPAIPSANAVSGLTDVSFNASWGTVSGASSYLLDVSTSNTFSTFVNLYNGFEVTGTSQTVSSLTPNTTYYYRVRSVNTSGASSYSNTISATTLLSAPTPAGPTNITVNSFTANWTGVAGATSYQLDVSSVSDFSSFVPNYNNLSVLSPSTSQSVTGVNPTSTTYYYRLRAVNSSGPSLNSYTATVTPLPGVPSALAASAITTSSFTINWSAGSNASSYLLDVSTDSNFTGVSSISVSGTSYNNSGLTSNTVYYYRLRSVNVSGTSNNSNVVSVVTLPPAPTATTPTGITETSFIANWSSVTAQSQLDVSTASDFSSFVYNSIAITSGSSYTVAGLTGGVTYYYRVRSLNASGTSTNSNVVTVLTLPPAPTAGAATGTTLSGFTANWSIATSATGYRLDVATDNLFTNKLASYNDLLVSTTSQSVTSLSAGTTYYYRIRAVNASGTSTNSTSISVLTFPSTPTSSAASTVTSSSFIANWGSVTSATSYRLDVSTVNTFASFLTGYNNLTVTGTSQSVSGLTAGTTYYYRVRAVNATGTSSSSSTATVPTITIAPVATAASSTSATSFTANWGSVVGATSYRLDVATDAAFVNKLTNYNDLSVASTSQSVTSLISGTTYYYRVRGFNSSGASASSSNTITQLLYPASPVINTTSIAPFSFIANWGSLLSAIDYRLDVATDNSFVNLVPGYSDILVSGTSYTVTNLSHSSTYYYRMRARNATGFSSYSSPAQVITPQQFTGLNENYIVSYSTFKEGILPGTTLNTLPRKFISQTIQYIDGLGRPKQTVNTQASPLLKDIVQPVVYDDYGREAKKYLPFVAENTGWIKPNVIDLNTGGYINAALNFYNNNADKIADDTRPFSEAILETSPLSRVIEQSATGAAWQPDLVNSYTSTDRTIKFAYESNLASEVLLWKFTYPTEEYTLTAINAFGKIDAGTAAAPTYYAANQLIKKKTKDEQYNEVIEYVDKQGRTVLKRVQVVSGAPAINDANYASTYYVYDDFGNLVSVIPPEAVKRITQTTPASEYLSMTDTQKNDFLKRWAFRYRYDSRNRMIMKQVPGAEPVYMIYDNRDRLILTQDGNQRAGATNAIKYWTFTKYDELNRPIMTGIKDTTTTIQLLPSQMQTAVNNHFAKTASRFGETYVGNVAGNVHGYTNKAYPVRTGSTEIDPNKYLTVTYYDNYSFRSLFYGTYTYVNESLSEIANGITYTQPVSENLRVVGKATGTKTKVLDGGVRGEFTWLKTVSYYDDNYRVVQTLADNYKGGTDRVTNVMDFVGRTLKSKTTHAEADVTWKDVVGLSIVGNKLLKTATADTWGNSGAASVQQLAVGQNGWLEFTVSELTTYRMVGLSDANPDANYTTIDYALYQALTGFLVYENGVLKFTATGALVPGEVLRVERNGSVVTYKRNGTTVYTSTVPSSSLLMADAALYSGAATIAGVETSFSSTTRSVTQRFEYDHAGRLLKTRHQTDAGSEILLAVNFYNELGQLVDKKLHSTVDTGSDAKQSVDYRYNIRGWLTKINEGDINVGFSDPSNSGEARDFFGMQLAYENTDLGIGNTAQYNGNISAMTWSNNLSLGTNKQNGFVYSNDPMNRLTLGTHKLSATLGTWTAGQYEESISSYDLNGNIQALQRKGPAGAQIDNLTYNYGAGTTLSNKLLYVQDNTTNTADRAKGFIDGQAGTAQDYTYDVNGNMNRDLNKGIGTTIADATNLITYNFLNLPETVTKGTNSIRYIYDATGRKLAQVTTFGGQQKAVDYTGEFQYENDLLQFISHAEGRIAIAGTQSIYMHSGDALTGITAATSTLATAAPANGEKYISATSVGTTAKQGMFPIGGSFTVQAGEQYRIRAKGYRTGANSVHLYIRTNSIDLNWPGAALASGAAAESSAEQIITIPAGHTTLQAGVVWNTVTAGQQFFLNDFEITKLTINATPEYQYNLKDHLGNVRLTFTTKDETINQTATLEDANLNTEQSQFLRVATAKRINATLFDHTNGSSTGYSERLNGSANEKYGVAESLSVMPGDVINAEVYAKYADPVTTNWTGALSTLMSQIAANTAGVVVDGASYTTSTSSFPPGFIGLQTNSDNGAPKAYLNWLVFDRNYGIITGGFKQITTVAKEAGSDVAHERVFNTSPIVITQPGYVYIYLSNEAASPVEVFFDDFKVTHTKSPVIQQDDYYPFGLTYNSYSRENSTANNYLYNGKEKQDELGLDWFDYGQRMFDPALGRWWVIDPLTQKMPNWSPYAYAFNNPIRFIDVGGAFPYPVTVRAFAPPGSFKGTGFGDDRRGYSANTNVTSRTSQTITIDPTARSVSGGAATSSDTHWNGWNAGNATESNRGGVDSKSFFKNSMGSDVAAVDAHFESANPAFKGIAPDIEVQSSIILSENDKEGYVNASIDLSSKQFPATEAIISDPSKQSVFLTGAAAFGGAGNLVKADSKKAASIDIRINIDKKGNFTGVVFGGKTYSVKDWNKAQTAKPAGPFPRDDKDKK